MDFGELSLPARVGLAAGSGMLYWPALVLDDRLGVLTGHTGRDGQYAQFAWGALFGAVVLAPYVWGRSRRVLRVIALCAASALIYLVAFFYVFADSINRMDTTNPLVLAGGAGALMSAVAVRWIGGSRLSWFGWVCVVAAGVAGGELFAVFQFDVSGPFGPYAVSSTFEYFIGAVLHATWQVLVCVALYYAAREPPSYDRAVSGSLVSKRLKVLGAILLLMSCALPLLEEASYYADPQGRVHEYQRVKRDPIDAISCILGCPYIIPKGTSPIFNGDPYVFGVLRSNANRADILGLLSSYQNRGNFFWQSLLVLTFMWPVATVVVIGRRRQSVVALIARLVEPLLLAWSGTLIWFMSVKPLIEYLPHRVGPGAYMAFAALGLYAVGALASDIESFRAWRVRRG